MKDSEAPACRHGRLWLFSRKESQVVRFAVRFGA